MQKQLFLHYFQHIAKVNARIKLAKNISHAKPQRRKGIYVFFCVLASWREILFEIENLVLWARSELSGYAEEKWRGMMEYWKVGIMGS